MTLVLAHRGASKAARENTQEAFRLAAGQGADGVELDVHLMADDELAVHHDARLPDGRSLWELSRDDLPEWVPTLA